MTKYYINNGHNLPAHWEWLLPQNIKELSFPRENRSDCFHCPSKVNQYEHEARCCTYRPQIANFLIGLSLTNDLLDATKLKKVHKEYGFHPLALMETPQALENQEKLRDEDPLKLPVCHFWSKESGCTVHSYRNYMCSTFFCLGNYGHQSEFWDAICDFMMMVENNIAWWCMDQLGLDTARFTEEMISLDEAHADKETWEQNDMSSLWQSWARKELEYFQKASQLVTSHKDRLLEIALSYMDEKGDQFIMLIESYPDEGGNTHLPATREALEGQINVVMKEYGKINANCDTGLEGEHTGLSLSEDAYFVPSASAGELAEYYESADSFLLLNDEQGFQIDFHPLSKGEYRFLSHLLSSEGHSPEQKVEVTKELSELVRMLIMRDFISNAR